MSAVVGMTQTSGFVRYPSLHSTQCAANRRQYEPHPAHSNGVMALYHWEWFGRKQSPAPREQLSMPLPALMHAPSG
jgi:hypothetical protein